MKVYYPNILYNEKPIVWEINLDDQASCCYVTKDGIRCNIKKTNQYLEQLPGLTRTGERFIIVNQSLSGYKATGLKNKGFFSVNPKLKEISLTFEALTDEKCNPTAWADSGSWDTLLPSKNRDQQIFNLPFVTETNLINQLQKAQLLLSTPFKNGITKTLKKLFDKYITPTRAKVTPAVFNYYQGVISEVLIAGNIHINQYFCQMMALSPGIYPESINAPDTTLQSTFALNLLHKKLFSVGVETCMRHFHFLVNDEYPVDQLTTHQEVQVFLVEFRTELDASMKEGLSKKIMRLSDKLTVYFGIIYNSVNDMMKLKTDLSNHSYTITGYQSFYQFLISRDPKLGTDNISSIIKESIRIIHKCLESGKINERGPLHEDKDFYISNTLACELKYSKSQKKFFMNFTDALTSELERPSGVALSSPRR